MRAGCTSHAGRDTSFAMETMTAQPIEQAAIDAGTDIPEIVAPAARRKLGTLRSLGPFLKRYRWRLLIALVMLLVSSGAFLSVPLAFRGDRKSTRLNSSH